MQCQKTRRANQYLNEFDRILCQMAEKMLNANITNNITLDFIHCMIPHHQAAIYMSENLLQYTTYPPLQKIARDIIAMQTRGIQQMEEIARTTPRVYNSMADVRCYMENYLKITHNMLEKMEHSPRYCNINLSFVGEMIPHHEGAISMCENLLQYRIDSRLRSVAANIIQEQSQGVKELMEVKKNLSRY